MSLSDKKFCVLLPILEREDIVNGFPKALKSIFSNTLIPDQVLVVVDGKVSTSFRKLILSLKSKYLLDIIWTNKKVGLENALNIGLTKCKHDFIFRADGDDINHKDRFEKQLPFLLNGFDLVGSNIDEYDENDNFIATKKVPISLSKIIKTIPFRNPLNHMTVGYKKNVVLELGGYPSLFLKEDYGLWIKFIFNKKNIKNIDRSLVKAITGRRMIKDRGGLKYIYSEFLLQKFLLSYGLTNIILGFFVFLLRSLIFFLPARFKKVFYLKFLRNSSKS